MTTATRTNRSHGNGPSTVLVITNEFDLTADAVIVRLQEWNVPVFRLNTERFCEAFGIRLELDRDEARGEFYSQFGSLQISEIQSAYYRRPQYPDLPNLASEEREFVLREMKAFLRWLWLSLREVSWLNKPHRIREAESKIDQLIRASKLGLRTPRTLITNDPERVREFFHSCGGQLITKSLSSGFIVRGGEQHHIYTNRVAEEKLESLEGVQLLPCVFQERIYKLVELRVTVVGNEVFAAEIHSQQHRQTRDDWRRHHPDTRYKTHSLPQEVAQACLDLVAGYDLSFAALDLIVTPEYEYVFLELNPNGQWLWIETSTGLPICDAICRALANKNVS